MGSRYRRLMVAKIQQTERDTKRGIEAALMRGLQAALGATKQDSSRAAYHWTIVSSKGGGKAPGRRKFQSYHSDVRGRPPVGNRGDRGSNAEEVLTVRSRTEAAQIKRRLFIKNPDTVFGFYNPIMDIQDYAARARLQRAAEEAVGVAQEHFERNARRRKGGI